MMQTHGNKDTEQPDHPEPEKGVSLIDESEEDEEDQEVLFFDVDDEDDDAVALTSAVTSDAQLQLQPQPIKQGQGTLTNPTPQLVTATSSTLPTPSHSQSPKKQQKNQQQSQPKLPSTQSGSSPKKQKKEQNKSLAPKPNSKLKYGPWQQHIYNASYVLVRSIQRSVTQQTLEDFIKFKCGVKELSVFMQDEPAPSVLKCALVSLRSRADAYVIKEKLDHFTLEGICVNVILAEEFVQGQPDVASLFLSARRNYDQLADHIRTTRESVSKELSAAIQELIAMVEQIEKLESSVANNYLKTPLQKEAHDDLARAICAALVENSPKPADPANNKLFTATAKYRGLQLTPKPKFASLSPVFTEATKLSRACVPRSAQNRTPHTGKAAVHAFPHGKPGSRGTTVPGSRELTGTFNPPVQNLHPGGRGRQQFPKSPGKPGAKVPGNPGPANAGQAPKPVQDSQASVGLSQPLIDSLPFQLPFALPFQQQNAKSPPQAVSLPPQAISPPPVHSISAPPLRATSPTMFSSTSPPPNFSVQQPVVQTMAYIAPSQGHQGQPQFPIQLPFSVLASQYGGQPQPFSQFSQSYVAQPAPFAKPVPQPSQQQYTNIQTQSQFAQYAPSSLYPQYVTSGSYIHYPPVTQPTQIIAPSQALSQTQSSVQAPPAFFNQSLQGLPTGLHSVPPPPSQPSR